MKTVERGDQNPLIVIDGDEIFEWLRSKADEAGFSDRESCAVQFKFTDEIDGDIVLRGDLPQIVFMVSNIEFSRKPIT